MARLSRRARGGECVRDQSPKGSVGRAEKETKAVRRWGSKGSSDMISRCYSCPRHRTQCIIAHGERYSSATIRAIIRGMHHLHPKTDREEMATKKAMKMPQHAEANPAIPPPPNPAESITVETHTASHAVRDPYASHAVQSESQS